MFSDRLAAAQARWPDDAQVAEILAFIQAPSKRGLCKAGRDIDAGDEDD